MPQMYNCIVPPCFCARTRPVPQSTRATTQLAMTESVPKLFWQCMAFSRMNALFTRRPRQWSEPAAGTAARNETCGLGHDVATRPPQDPSGAPHRGNSGPSYAAHGIVRHHGFKCTSGLPPGIALLTHDFLPTRVFMTSAVVALALERALILAALCQDFACPRRNGVPTNPTLVDAAPIVMEEH